MRTEQHLTLTQLAQRSGVSKSYLSTIENGTGSRPGAAVLHKIGIALGLTLADILGRTIRPTTTNEVPASLIEFANDAGLPESDVLMLAGIKFRGEAPRTTERWQFIYNAIAMSAQAERD